MSSLLHGSDRSPEPGGGSVPGGLEESRRNDTAESDMADPRMRRLMEAAPDAMVLTNREGRIVLVNGQAERLFGYQRDEMLGQPVEMLIPQRYRQAHPHHRSKYMGQQRARPMGEGGVALYGLRKDGSEFPAEISLSPLDNDGGEDPIAIAAVRDVTDQRKAEAERMKLSQAQEAIRLRDEFLSIASHELRTPLTPIQLQIDGALRAARRATEKDLPAITSKLEALGSGIHRLSSLVNQLLDLSRINAGRLELDRSDVDLVQLVQRSLVAFEDEAIRAECAVEFESQAPRLRGRWDSSRLEQVLTNLLSNALRYGAGRPISIFAGRLREGTATLLVSDQGIGVAPEHLALIFRRFERVAESRHRGGFGLGLWIVRQIVDAHGGTIEVFSRLGMGASFAVELPIGEIDERDEEERAPLPPYVLLVDDDPDVRNAFREHLEGQPYVPVTAQNGFDALALLHFGLRPTHILVDDDMPNLDGSAFLAELRDLDLGTTAPLLIGLRDERSRSSGPSGSGVRLGLRKPWSRIDLLDALR